MSEYREQWHAVSINQTKSTKLCDRQLVEEKRAYLCKLVLYDLCLCSRLASG